MAIDLPAIKLVRTTPLNLVGEAAVDERLTVKPVAPGVWEEFLALQISPATRRSYAAGLRDFFRREFQVGVSPETILVFLNLSECSAIAKRCLEQVGHVIAYRGHLLAAQLSAGTVNARLAALKSFVTHAAKRKLCAFRLDDIKSVKAQTYTALPAAMRYSPISKSHSASRLRIKKCAS